MTTQKYQRKAYDQTCDRATVTSTTDLDYKSGYVQCACGWRKELGNGFNGYHIANCPQCTPDLHTRNQRKVVAGNPRKGLTVTLGDHVYFILSNGMHIQFSKNVYRTLSGLTEAQADRL